MRATATFCLTLLLALPAASCAQSDATAAGGKNRIAVQSRRPSPDRNAQPAERATRRLESVTWDSVKHQLTWVISQGQRDGRDYKALAQQDYLINMDKATMTVLGETRGFSRQEAHNVRVLMDLIAKYAVDSTLWWDDGQGEKLDENGAPQPKPRRDRKPSKDDNVKILHVSYPAPLSQSQVQSQIRELEARLAALKRLDRQITAQGLELRQY